MKALPLIVSVAAVTFACRALPLLLLAGRPFSQGMLTYLRYLPLGVLAAVAAAGVWPQHRGIDLPFVTGIGTAVVLAMRTGNMLITLLGAMIAAAVLRVL